jgi:hypothetical protein
VAGGINSRKPQAAAASASGGAIGDNSSTLQAAAACASGGPIGDNSYTLQDAAGMVDRLSPIDRNQEVPWPVG